MKDKKNLIILIILILFPIDIYPVNFDSDEFDIYGKIESIRKDNIITLFLYQRPDKDLYYIIDYSKLIGRVKIINVISYTSSVRNGFRAVAEYYPEKPYKIEGTIFVGLNFGLIKEKKGKDRTFGEPKYKEIILYKKVIKTPKDNRLMILIPEGNFIFGSDNGDRDEAPETISMIDDFYIDKYEVSNRDYLVFINETNSEPPLSWKNGKFEGDEADIPVLVSYYEAVSYAEWAGKRLPTEKEWEKSARGTGLVTIKRQDESYKLIKKPLKYPWGNEFIPENLNSSSFWDNDNSDTNTKKIYKKGLLPIDFFEGKGDSPLGVVNMAGNAPEWTSSWYKPYHGNIYSDKRYGNQLKVIRGGSWFSDNYRVRASNREIGGLPNLYKDNTAGFRCVKNPSVIDRRNNSYIKTEQNLGSINELIKK